MPNNTSSAKNPIVITTAQTLSNAADHILNQSQSGPLSKNTILNTLARAIQNDGRNWGALRNSSSPIRDPRIQPIAITESGNSPLIAAELFTNNLYIKIWRPEGRHGYLPKASISIDPALNIIITCPSWGPFYDPDPYRAITYTTLTIPSSKISLLATSYARNPSDLLKNIAWNETILGDYAHITPKHDHMIVAPFSCLIVPNELHQTIIRADYLIRKKNKTLRKDFNTPQQWVVAGFATTASDTITVSVSKPMTFKKACQKLKEAIVKYNLTEGTSLQEDPEITISHAYRLDYPEYISSFEIQDHLNGII